MSDCVPDDMSSDAALDVQAKESPPSTPPSPNMMTESDLKLSRKREREVSLEPATPKAISVDVDPGFQENKDFRTPAKKNRLHLDATAEEDDDGLGPRTPSHSPPLSTSPPHELKVRQISQGVEHLNWQNRMRASFGESAGDDGDKAAADAPPTPNVTAAILAEVGDPNDPSACLDGPASGSQHRRDSDTDSAERDKGLKRKLADRATSQGPQDASAITQSGSANLEPLKRQRDSADNDDNPRESKRPSPPPESDLEPKNTPAPKLTGFMAYASSSSPFSSVKGANIFSTAHKMSPSPPVFSATAAAPSPRFGYVNGESSSSMSQSMDATPTKRTGFEAFAGSGPAFASATRSKSPSFSSGSGLQLNRNRSPGRRATPANVNAFSSYATGGTQGFVIPTPKRARGGSANGGSSRSSIERNSTVSVFGSSGPGSSGGEDDDEDSKRASFGEKLRAGIDDEDDDGSDEEKVPLTELETTTGEEDEETVHQVRGKLFSLSSANQWKERGTGTLKLNVRRSDGGGARLVMRKEAVYTLLLNVTLFTGMRCFVAQDPRYLRFSVIEGGVTTHHNLRVSSAKVAQELLEEINLNIPTGL